MNIVFNFEIENFIFDFFGKYLFEMKREKIDIRRNLFQENRKESEQYLPKTF